MGGLCDFGVTPVPIGLRFEFGTALGLGLRGPDLGLGLDNFTVVDHPHIIVLRPTAMLKNWKSEKLEKRSTSVSALIPFPRRTYHDRT